jgi:hypothetical protein
MRFRVPSGRNKLWIIPKPSPLRKTSGKPSSPWTTISRINTQISSLYTPTGPNGAKPPTLRWTGLFNVGSSFSAGYGSEYGRGYVVDVHISTLERIPKGRKESILEDAVEELRRQLARRFPGRKLFVDRDRHVFKVHGDFLWAVCNFPTSLFYPNTPRQSAAS